MDKGAGFRSFHSLRLLLKERQAGSHSPNVSDVINPVPRAGCGGPTPRYPDSVNQGWGGGTRHQCDLNSPQEILTRSHDG